MFEPYGIGDAQTGRGEFDVALLVVEGDLEFVLGPGDPAQLVDEVHVPGGPAILPVGGRVESELLPETDHFADRVVLHLAQTFGVDLSCCVLFACP